jgi:short-subunit dehydrogenase
MVPPPPIAALAGGALLCYALASLIVRHTPALRRRRLHARLAGRHVWITGASQGLGLAIARAALAAGARVTLTSRSAARLSAAAAGLGGAASRVVLAPADVGAAGGGEAVRAAHAAGVAVHGPVDVAVANAGVNHGGRVFEALGDAEVEAVVATNLVGVARVFAAVLPGMRARRGGVAVAVGSLAGYRGVPGASVYGASKAGVAALVESVNVELCGSGVRAAVVCPGFVDTPAIAALGHAKPLMMSADAAAEVVLDAAACGRRHTGCPWLMEQVVMRLARAVPSPAYDWILHFTGDHRRAADGAGRGGGGGGKCE